MAVWNPDKYISAWNFASRAHLGQLVPGSPLPYIHHIANVAMEIMHTLAVDSSIRNPDLVVQCALLHDTLEDTETTFEALKEQFGDPVAAGVLALTKDKQLPSKDAQMADSLARIQDQPREIWMVKLADRITNLQPPPVHWRKPKILRYREEAKRILECLGSASPHLAKRLGGKIKFYAAKV